MAEDLKKQLETKDSLINTLQDSIKTLKDSLILKDDHIKTVENALKMKASSVEQIEGEIEKLTLEIDSLRKEVDILNDELSQADKDLEKLEMENDNLKQSNPSSSDAIITDFTGYKILKEQIIEKMGNILENGKHNVMITVLNIIDLQELHLYEVRSSVNLKISCSIDPSDEEQSSLLEEFLSLDNISIRNYTAEDRYSINCDGDVLLFAVKGDKPDNFLVIQTSDSNHIKLFNSFIMESWLRGRKIV